ncbi:hypothetical protein BCR41DRAFT_423375 [Lobosporangium transversale]|uniref:Uncharacterized protein n=1 Tax=Lobosporangium transversale TaxID=64571 RepID=A0A1Y2GJJ0_9FUNG|nr:hypothetical protein BCR41DRAFT_423375 [Lobosporangium transversale]ORZ11638.1 hypothetical protein BCR41DRAFT_423375 [Lobosporangium transversale]|eukprot:XP_021879735.1 hypothetical protein BCR41DRAFT_423375 [Lobosporangium transversale]
MDDDDDYEPSISSDSPVVDGYSNTLSPETRNLQTRRQRGAQRLEVLYDSTAKEDTICIPESQFEKHRLLKLPADGQTHTAAKSISAVTKLNAVCVNSALGPGSIPTFDSIFVFIFYSPSYPSIPLAPFSSAFPPNLRQRALVPASVSSLSSVRISSSSSISPSCQPSLPSSLPSLPSSVHPRQRTLAPAPVDTRRFIRP